MPSSKVHLSIHIGQNHQQNQQGNEEEQGQCVYLLPVRSNKSTEVEQSRFNVTPVASSSSNTQTETPQKGASGSTGPEAQHLEACFRGRQLRGQRLMLPPGYKGCVTATGPPPKEDVQGSSSGRGGGEDRQDEEEGGPRHCKHWIIRHTFDSLAYFNHDTPPSRSDLPRRVFDWLEVSKQVHAPVSKSQVEAQLMKMQ